MNVCVIIVFCIFIASIYAELNVIYQNPNITMLTNTLEFKVEIDNEVNRPEFSSYIRIYTNTTTKKLVYQIDASTNNSNITYANKTLIFHTPDSIEWNRSTEYYITLDEGVLYSDKTSNSTARMLKLLANDTPSIDSTTVSAAAVITDIITTTTPSDSSDSTSATKATKSSTTLWTLSTGEPPPTRSAQLGMGLGITFIGIIIIGEIIYFKYFYRGNLRRNNYQV